MLAPSPTRAAPQRDRRRRREEKENDEEPQELSDEDDLSDAPAPPRESDFVSPSPQASMVRTNRVLRELQKLTTAAPQEIAAAGQYNHLYGSLTAPPLSTESDTSAYASESDVLSEAAQYTRRHRSAKVKARSRRARATKARSNVSEALEPILPEEELRCAHCVTPDPDAYMGYVTVYKCCPRKSHTVCVANNPTARALLHGAFDLSPPGTIEDIVASNAPTPCLSCLRPAQLLTHRELLTHYAEYFSAAAAAAKEAPRESTGLFNRVFRRDRIAAAKEGEEERASIDELLERGHSLESIAEKHELRRIDDEYAEAWVQLGFTVQTLLYGLSDTDLLFYMREYDVHPYVLRQRFRIKLADLWVGQEERVAAIREFMDRAPDLPTADACEKFRALPPVRLALMGFDTHHLLQMGLTKADFARFPAYSLSDWVNTLGFCKPHWWLLKLSLEDLTTAPIGRGWSVANLVAEWRLQINDLQSMGLINVDTMLHQLDGARESPEPPNPSAPRQRAARLRATDVYLSRKYGVW